MQEQALNPCLFLLFDALGEGQGLRLMRGNEFKTDFPFQEGEGGVEGRSGVDGDLLERVGVVWVGGWVKGVWKEGVASMGIYWREWVWCGWVGGWVV